MSRGPVARSLEELDDLERQNLEAGTMGEAYSPPADTMEAINRVAVRPDDEQPVPVAAIAGTMEPRKKTQLESLQEWIAAENAKLSGMTHEREKAIAEAKAASREGDTGRSIVNSIAAAGSVLAGNKDLAKGYIAAASEDRGAAKAAQDDAALRAWVAKQQEGIGTRGKMVQSAIESDASDQLKRDLFQPRGEPAKPREPTPEETALKKAQAWRLMHPTQAATKSPAAPKSSAPPTSVLTTLADIDSAQTIMGDLLSGRPEPEGIGSRIKSAVMGQVGQTNEGQYNTRRKAAAQLIGGILEGGKLSDRDFPRYLDLMPAVGDTKEQAQNKADSLRRQLNSKAQSLKASFSGAGYRMPSEPTGPVEMVGPKGEVDTVEPQFVEQAKKDGWRIR